jgi:hypothetical protein
MKCVSSTSPCPLLKERLTTGFPLLVEDLALSVDFHSMIYIDVAQKVTAI